MKKCIVFTIRGDFARFRKPYTTTSALTFVTIHPIAVKGLIGAILGIEKNDLYNELKDVKIGIQVLKDIKKDMGSFKLLTMKSGSGMFHFPSNVEFLRNVQYRVFFQAEESLLNKIQAALENRFYVFTPYLGVSEHIAVVDFEGTYPIENSEKNQVDTLLPIEKADIDFQNEYVLYTDKIPVENNQKREYIRYDKVIIPVGRTIKGDFGEVYKVGGYYVYLF